MIRIQLFGFTHCQDTRKAQRFFKERGLTVRCVDMEERPAAWLPALRVGLGGARGPEGRREGGWRSATSLAYMRELVEYWRTKYEWRLHEARLNRLRQFTVELGGIELHFIHEPGVGGKPL